ncbi:hydrogenase formation protein HypD [Verrucomicrobiota bacterium]
MMIDSCIADIKELADRIGRSVTLMEVCGTHTMAAFRTGVKGLLPDSVHLLSGPGCPVCVTPNEYLDKAIAISDERDVLISTFGDMVRVPGSYSSLERKRAQGADIRVVYSPLDALETAREEPGKRVVFLGVGFETTTPAVAWTIDEAKRAGITNYSVLCAHKTIPGAMSALLADGKVSVDGFMCPGHVSVIIGAGAYEPLCEKYNAPCVVAGFEAGDILRAIRALLKQIADNRGEVENEYARSVTQEGNFRARAACERVFEECSAEWRGLGVIPDSGLKIREEFEAQDAGKLFAGIKVPESRKESGCICGDILRGMRQPGDCSLFGDRCTPSMPVGACMVSSEGTCAAHFKYGRKKNG